MAKKEKKDKKFKKAEEAQEVKKVNRRKQLAEAKRYIKENKNKLVRLTNNPSNKQILITELEADPAQPHHSIDPFYVECGISIALLVVVLFLFSCYAPPQQIADYVSLIFVVVAHFLASAIIISVLQQKSTEFFVVANIVTPLIYWGASIFVTVLVRAMDMVAVGTVVFAQLVVFGVAAVFAAAIYSFHKLNVSKAQKEEVPTTSQQ